MCVRQEEKGRRAAARHGVARIPPTSVMLEDLQFILLRVRDAQRYRIRDFHMTFCSFLGLSFRRITPSFCPSLDFSFPICGPSLAFTSLSSF